MALICLIHFLPSAASNEKYTLLGCFQDKPSRCTKEVREALKGAISMFIHTSRCLVCRPGTNAGQIPQEQVPQLTTDTGNLAHVVQGGAGVGPIISTKLVSKNSFVCLYVIIDYDTTNSTHSA